MQWELRKRLIIALEKRERLASMWDEGLPKLLAQLKTLEGITIKTSRNADRADFIVMHKKLDDVIREFKNVHGVPKNQVI